ncbi:MAG: hypothetical protein J7527_05935, partial [Chitinophagaceae bacterium]|nr:hypothetical protein [Chitinophagaceae bacterium]
PNQMLSLSTRPFTEREKDSLRKDLPSVYKKVERFVTAIVFGGIISAPAFSGLTEYHKVTLAAKWYLGITISLVIIAIAWWWAIWKTGVSAKAILNEIENGTAEAFYVKPLRVVERKDPEDFGPAYYFDVEYKGERKTLFLWGQYFYFTEEEQFPSSEFEYVRKSSDKDFIALNVLGSKIVPELELPPFAKEIWDKGYYHEDGQILDESIDEIIRENDRL